MLLAVDIGNTNTVVSVFDKSKNVAQFAALHTWRVKTDVLRTSDEYVATLQTLANCDCFNVKNVNKAIISSVVPSLTSVIFCAVKKLCNVEPFVMTNKILSSSKIPLSIECASNEMGTDLICDAMGAWQMFSKANIVVDFGTALSFTVTDSKGIIQGVDIAPGLETAVKSLFANTAQLPQVSLVCPASSIGTTTTESIQAGVVLGYKGLVQFLVNEIKKDLFNLTGDSAENIKVIATGGLSGVLSPICDIFDAVDATLTMKGLCAIADTFI